jgi:uncharacterized membrane protein YhfC
MEFGLGVGSINVIFMGLSRLLILLLYLFSMQEKTSWQGFKQNDRTLDKKRKGL